MVVRLATVRIRSRMPQQKMSVLQINNNVLQSRNRAENGGKRTPKVVADVSNPAQNKPNVPQSTVSDKNNSNETQSSTGSDSLKIFSCHLCKYKGAKKSSLRNHMLIHTTKKYSCTECDYACHTDYHLKRHMFTHSDNKPNLCPICGYTCTMNFKMNAHLKQHEDDPEFVGNFGSATQKKKQRLDHGGVTKPFECSVCSYTCTRQWRLKAHLRIHSQDKLLLKCNICDFTSVSASQLKDHKASHSQGVNQSSHSQGVNQSSHSQGVNKSSHTQGGVIKTSQAQGVSKTSQAQEDVIKCGMCNFICTQPLHLNHHMKTHTTQTTYNSRNFSAAYEQNIDWEQREAEAACVVLDMESDWGTEDVDDGQPETYAAFTEKQEGNTYTVTTMDDGQTYIILAEAKPETSAQQLTPAKEKPKISSPKFHCEHCQFTCNYKSTLAVHMKKHSSVKKFQCANCKFVCIDAAIMKDHLLNHSLENLSSSGISVKNNLGQKENIKIHTGQFLYSCKECEFTCDSGEELKSHMSNHYTCDVCAEGFSSSYYLKKHKVIHGEKPLQCQFCDFNCLQKRKLASHLLQHKHQRIFHCNLCSATYKKEESLKIHMMSHQNIKKFACNLCNYAGNRSADFRRHMLTHSTAKPLQCSQCSYSCIRKSRMKAHMVVHSGGKTGSHRKGISLPKAYHCAFCEFSCTRTSRLKAHISKVHLDLPENITFTLDLKQIVPQ